MAENSIIRALSIVHQQRLQQGDGLWRLDSPTEAALVAQLCNRQRDEEVVVSVGNPQPEPENFCFAHLAPPHILGSDKMKHHYVLGQQHHHCAVELAAQKGLLPPHKTQNAATPEAIPCSPVAATPQHSTDEQPSTPCRKTPLSHLRADVSAAEDSSPANNILRRLAAEISQDDPALQETLDVYRRSTASRHSSFRVRSSRQSECSLDGNTTPVASPGRGWVQTPSAKHWDTLEFDLQCSSTCHTPTSASGAHCCSDSDAGAEAGAAMRPAGTSPAQQQQAAADIPEGLKAVATSSVPTFKGFGSAVTQDPTLVSTDSAKLPTPRLVELRCVSVSSTSSSSNSTASPSPHEVSTCAQKEAAAAVQDSAAAPTDKQAVLAVTTSTAMNEHAFQQVTEGSFAPSAAGPGATGSYEAVDGGGLHAAGSPPGSRAHPAHLPIESAFLETGFWGSRDSSGNGTITTDQPGSHSPLSAAASPARQHGGCNMTTADSGFLSCDEDMEQQEYMSSVLHSPGQHGSQGPAHAGSQSTAAAAVVDTPHTYMQAATAAGSFVSTEPCQLPLSPMLLRQHTQSFKKVAAEPAAAGYARSDAATSCCDWATVYSYEEMDS